MYSSIDRLGRPSAGKIYNQYLIDEDSSIDRSIDRSVMHKK